MTLVSSIMRRDLVIATRNEDIGTAIERLGARNVGALLVVSDGRVCGILSERDVLRRVIAQGREPRDTLVGAVATANPITVGAEASIEQCAQLMRSSGLRHLPIVDGERHPIGMISARDLLQYVVEDSETRSG